jgi:glycosyltransferase involved in cell wall biosynthesis
MPKVSVIIITYNRSELLRAAIRSVLEQSYQDFELLVVDDASSDNTAEVVQGFDDKRIRYIRHETNKREAEARNTGVQNSTGEYIAFLDDDDEWLPKKLERQVELLDNSPRAVGGVYTGFIKMETTGKIVVQIVPSKRGNILHDMFTQNWIGTPSTVLLRKECFEKVGLFDKGIVFGPDYDMWIRISKEFQFDYIVDPLVKYYVHDNKLSTNCEIMIKGMEAINRKYDQFFALSSRNYSYRYLGLGVYYCYSGDMKKGRENLLKAMKLHPFEIRHYFNTCLSFFGAQNFRKIKELKEKWLT